MRVVQRINRTQDGVTQYPMHTHRGYEVMLYLEGEGAMRTSQGDIPFQSGTVVIVPPGVAHGSTSAQGFRNISVEGDFDGYFHFDTVKTFCDSDRCEGRMLAEMIYENRYANERYLSALCTAYACFLMQRFESESMLWERVRRAVLEISQNAFDSGVDLAGILSESGYSEDYIRACFKRCTGKTPNEFLTEIRMKHACFLMEVYGDALSLSAVAERCGYLDYVYFSKKFKETLGVSPRGYRNAR